jgi:hypothetical protein
MTCSAGGTSEDTALMPDVTDVLGRRPVADFLDLVALLVSSIVGVLRRCQARPNDSGRAVRHVGGASARVTLPPFAAGL